jgi:uncharacterized damage-inducible protein DinB
MARGRALDVEQELLEAFRQSGRVSEYLVEVLPASLWRTAPPGGRGRSLAAIVAHMQSVRRTFARMGGARPGRARARASSLDRNRSTPLQAQRALRESTDDLARLFETAITERRARVKGMPRRVVNMLMYLVQHDAHHRGQICGLARDLGHEFSSEDTMRIWGWKVMPPTR